MMKLIIFSVALLSIAGVSQGAECKDNENGDSSYTCKETDMTISCNSTCNYEVNCPWGDDECYCQCIDDLYSFSCSAGYHWDKSGVDCIPYFWVCDNIPDCANGEDESKNYCAYCTNGQVIPGNWWQDNIVDCDDGSDERATCNASTVYTIICDASANICVPNTYYYCGPYPNCPDFVDPQCPECDGYSIPWNWICDGWSDCSDSRDEMNCPCNSSYPMIDCNATEVWNSGSNTCMADFLKCDGVVHCEDGRDEADCPSPTLPSTTSTPAPEDSIPKMKVRKGRRETGQRRSDQKQMRMSGGKSSAGFSFHSKDIGRRI